jgi:Lon protease-like protein
VYHRPVIPQRERLLQLARLAGIDVFTERFGPPQSAAPDPDALRRLVDERLDAIARALVEEAAASDDVTDAAGAQSYLEDRLTTLGDLLAKQQGERLRSAFRERTKEW